ncbi:L,D-transpeptidase family protein [Pseudomonas sp. MMS21-TM103]|uniref:L,D-transpeptidase family protein n=1 Tax=Pseudomonas sp. MMS21 TM103 TaxID=2886506 RepID=UPI001EDD809C|nr:L,D-transpeptidase family protein [Pseudomonas sp. MMS21 TM103]MCG4452510.1 L,D-transpeptidase family protein [Pseudomonas sp. MMS21 TM103]
MDFSARLYKKTAHFLTAGYLLAITIQAYGADDNASQAIRQSFAAHPSACASTLAAAEQQSSSLLHEFYAQEAFLPLWREPSRRAALLHELEQLADDGLDPNEYRLDSLRTPLPKDIQQRTCADLLISHSYLQALQHLSRGRLAQEPLEPFWRAPDSVSPTPRPSVLSLAMQGLDNLPAAFAAARPALHQYQQLRRAYAERRRLPLGEWTPLPSGRLLRPDRRDARVPLLVDRLVAEGYIEEPTAAASDRYDASLVAAVKRFQARHGLQADGVIGPDSLTALNTSAAARLEQLRVNLERWRWLAGDIEANTLLVNIAGGQLSYYRDHQLLWQGRAQVGRPERQTPQLKSLVSRLTLNPTWTVPPTIMREDKLPEIRRDLGYLALHQLRVLDRAGNPLDPTKVDWQHPEGIILRQDAGPKNPLGQLVIRFANPFSVYLHDTPSQHLFSKSPRAFSSGCVRIEGIMELLDVLLPADDCAEIARQLASGKTKEFPLRERLPIVLAYWTAEVDADGELILRNDLYARDQKVLAALQRNTY